MSDVNPEGPEVPELSDEQALAEIDLTEFGADTSTAPDNLELLHKIANDSLDIVLAAAEEAKKAAKADNATDPKSIARKRVNEVPATDALTSTFDDVLEALFLVIDNDPAQAAPALTGLGGIIKYVSDVRDVEIARVTADVKGEQGIDPNTPDIDENALRALCGLRSPNPLRPKRTARAILSRFCVPCLRGGPPVPLPAIWVEGQSPAGFVTVSRLRKRAKLKNCVTVFGSPKLPLRSFRAVPTGSSVMSWPVCLPVPNRRRRSPVRCGNSQRHLGKSNLKRVL
jgi:hypothetical protein